MNKNETRIVIEPIQQVTSHGLTSGHITLVENGSAQSPQTALNETITIVSADDPDEVRFRKMVLSVLQRKMATRKFLRMWVNAATKRKRELLDQVLAELRADGIMDLVHGRFRLRKDAAEAAGGAMKVKESERSARDVYWEYVEKAGEEACSHAVLHYLDESAVVEILLERIDADDLEEYLHDNVTTSWRNVENT